MELYSPKLIEPKEEQREERSGSTLDVPTESHITNDDDANYENLNEDTDDEVCLKCGRLTILGV
jgi:hypothetical protein